MPPGAPVTRVRRPATWRRRRPRPTGSRERSAGCRHRRSRRPCCRRPAR
jgi:hypothetical protein